ncbi:MAG: hypothetical protein AAGK22_24180 [Acidobacteriota bacterium]
MPQVSETIPESLQQKVEAAVSWFNSSKEAGGETFEVTGILDAEQSVAHGGDELRLILCGGDRCEQRAFHVSGSADLWEIRLADALPTQQGKPQAELDPPPGPRLRWLDTTLEKHTFVILLFYRGFW